jgi:hypothetical protein
MMKGATMVDDLTTRIHLRLLLLAEEDAHAMIQSRGSGYQMLQDWSKKKISQSLRYLMDVERTDWDHDELKLYTNGANQLITRGCPVNDSYDWQTALREWDRRIMGMR